MLYYFIHEAYRLLPSFSTEIRFYRRYIDNVFGIWYHGSNPTLDKARWKAFKEATPFGILRWTFTEPAKYAHFLDVQLNVRQNQIVTKIYEKEENLYTYLPPHSCHSPGVTYGSIYGGIKRIFELTSSPADIHTDVNKFFQRWLRQGHDEEKTRYLFNKAMKVYSLRKSMSKFSLDKEKPNHDEVIFHHLEYHP